MLFIQIYFADKNDTDDAGGRVASARWRNSEQPDVRPTPRRPPRQDRPPPRGNPHADEAPSPPRAPAARVPATPAPTTVCVVKKLILYGFVFLI